MLSEVLVDPTQNLEASSEWVEIFNPTALSLDLAGWVLADNISSKPLPQTILGPGAYLVVAGKIDIFLANQPGFRGSVVGSPGGRIGNGLSNEADMIVLKDPSGQMADSLNWGRPQASWPNYHNGLWDPGLSLPPPGYVLARATGQEAVLSASAWVSSSRLSAGQPNPPLDPSPTPSATPTRTPSPSPSYPATPSATSAGNSTPAAGPTGTPVTVAIQTPSRSSSPTIEAALPTGMPSSFPPPLYSSTRTPGPEVALPAGAPTLARMPATQATAAPAPTPLAFSLLFGNGVSQEQEATASPSPGATSLEKPVPVQPASGLQVLPFLFMAIPLLGLAFWLKDRLLP